MRHRCWPTSPPPRSRAAPLPASALDVASSANSEGHSLSPQRIPKDIRLLLSDPAEGVRSGPLCVGARGFSLHAATTVAAHDRDGLERLCRYAHRPPLAYGRLQRLDAERLSLALKTPCDNGTTHVVFSPRELVEKLAALVPPPRGRLTRYHGVLAPHAADRAHIVPGPDTTEGPAATSTPAALGGQVQRLAWAHLLARVFAVDITLCPSCGGRMQWVAPSANSEGHSRRSGEMPEAFRAYANPAGIRRRFP